MKIYKNHRNCRNYKVWWRCPSEWLAQVESRSVFYVGDFCSSYELDVSEEACKISNNSGSTKVCLAGWTENKTTGQC